MIAKLQKIMEMLKRKKSG